MNRPYISKTLRRFGASLTAVGVIVLCANSLFAQTGSEKSAPEKPEAKIEKESKNQKMTREAWDEYNANRFDVAIAKAEECIVEFRRTAAKMQDELKKEKEPEPPIGGVSEEALKTKIFNRGPLNDVATCHFIIGEANLKLSKRADDKKQKNEYLAKAKKAYEEAAKLTYARTWDTTPPGWFWNPALTATERLEDMPAIQP